MPFDAATFQLVEDALSECFTYHDALDTFVVRSGVPKGVLRDARKLEEERGRSSHSYYSRAPKRFVVQKILSEISRLGNDEDRIIANLITGLVKGRFPDATTSAIETIEALKDQIEIDKVEKDRKRQKRTEEIKKQESDERRQREKTRQEETALRENFRQKFVYLCEEENPQTRGYQFETFLNEYFQFVGLEPRTPFKNVGEQIDGSFIRRSTTHLIEAKWTKEPVAGAEFGAFNYKIDGKTADSRGLYVSVNGYSFDTIKSLNSKGSLRFVCIDGAHIMRSFLDGQSLPNILETVWRHADETGEAYLRAPLKILLFRASSI